MMTAIGWSRQMLSGDTSIERMPFILANITSVNTRSPNSIGDERVNMSWLLFTNYTNTTRRYVLFLKVFDYFFQTARFLNSMSYYWNFHKLFCLKSPWIVTIIAWTDGIWKYGNPIWKSSLYFWDFIFNWCVDLVCVCQAAFAIFITISVVFNFTSMCCPCRKPRRR